MAEELADVQANENSTALAREAGDKPIIGRDSPRKPVNVRESIKAAVKEVRIKEDKTGRLHAEDGKFHPKVEAPKEAAPSEVKEEPKVEAKKDEQPAPVSAPVAGPPPGWSPESKALYASLPDPIKADVLKRENEVSSGFKSKSEEIKRYQEVERVLSQRRPNYQSFGLKDHEAIERLFQWEAQIRANPEAALRQLAQNYGVNLNPPNSQSQLQKPEDIPPGYQPLVDQFGRLNQELSSIKSEVQRTQEERIASELKAFAKDKPHFERVRVAMGQLMNAGVANDLDTAYQKALLLDPEIQAEIKAEDEAKRLAETKAKDEQRLKAAAKAAVSPATRAPSSTAIVSGKQAPGVRGSILKAIEEVRGNGRA